jgi:hypothetical protein
MTNQLDLNIEELARLKRLVGPDGSTGQYTQAYLEVLKINDEHQKQGLAHLDDQTRYWFEKAAQITGGAAPAESRPRRGTARGLDGGRAGFLLREECRTRPPQRGRADRGKNLPGRHCGLAAVFG